MSKNQRLFAFAYSVLVIASLLGLFYVSGKDLAKVNSKSSTYADFIGYYRCGKMVLSEDRKSIYDRQLQLQYFNSLGAAQESTQFIYSQNPPFFFLLLAPFALLPIEQSFKLWILLSIICTGASLYLLMKSLYACRFPSVCLLTLASLLSAPGWICIFVGQMSWFMTCLFSLYFCGLAKRRDFLCGLALALTASKFQYLPFLCIPLIVQKRWKALAWAAATGLILLILSAVVLGVENVIGYPLTLINAETTKDYIGVFPEYMISIRGVFNLFLDRHTALWLSSLCTFLSLVPIFMLWRRQIQIANIESAAWAMSITVLTALLFSAHTHIYDDLLLALAAAISLPLFAQTPKTITFSGITSDPEIAERVSVSARSIGARLWLYTFLAFPFLSWFLFVICSITDSLKRTPFTLLNFILLLAALNCFFKCGEKHRSEN